MDRCADWNNIRLRFPICASFFFRLSPGTFRSGFVGWNILLWDIGLPASFFKEMSGSLGYVFFYTYPLSESKLSRQAVKRLMKCQSQIGWQVS